MRVKYEVWGATSCDPHETDEWMISRHYSMAAAVKAVEAEARRHFGFGGTGNTYLPRCIVRIDDDGETVEWRGLGRRKIYIHDDMPDYVPWEYRRG